MRQFLVSLLIATLCMTSSGAVESASFDLLAATPEGSWQIREDVDTNAKGKQSVMVTKTSLVGRAQRNGEPHYWIEMAVDSFKVKKSGQRKKNGSRLVMKSLIPASAFADDPANLMSNLRAFGVETIFQNGNEDPMRITSTGGMLEGIMNAMQANIDYDFKALGTEQITLSSGTFETKKMQGSGTVDMKILFKKMRVETDSTLWLSNKVPFGMVKAQGTTLTNGKQSSNASVLLEYGASGAVSEITKPVVDMPELPSLGRLLGN